MPINRIILGAIEPGANPVQFKPQGNQKSNLRRPVQEKETFPRAGFGNDCMPENTPHKKLKRTVGTTDAVFLILANVIGVGIFIFQQPVAEAAGNAYWYLALWLIGGLIALAGALSSSALGVIMPHAGGDYVFLSRTYGSSFGFLYGYLSFILSYSGSIATMSFAVVQYQGQTLFGPHMVENIFTIPALGYSFSYNQVYAVILVLLLTLINYFGLKRSLILQKIITILPIIFLVGAGMYIIGDTLLSEENELVRNFNKSFADGSVWDFPAFESLLIALVPVAFTYLGWNAPLYLGEDIKHPERIIPRSMTIGVLAVTAIYVLFCTVILFIIPFSELAGKWIDIPSKVAGYLLGSHAGQETLAQKVTAIPIALIILGSVNASIIGGSRLYLAMARDRIFFSHATKIHDKYETPSWSLWAQGIWTSLLIIIIGDLNKLLDYTMIALLFLSALTIACVFIIRYRHHKGHFFHEKMELTQLKAFGYPYLPILYIVATVLIIGGLIIENGWVTGVASFVIVVSGLLFYKVWKRNKSL